MSGLCSFNIRTRWLVLLLFFDRRLFGIFGKLIIFYYIQKSFVFFNEFFNSILPSYLSRDTRFSQVSNYFSHPWNKAKKLFSSSRHEISTSGIISISSKFSTSQIDLPIYKSISIIPIIRSAEPYRLEFLLSLLLFSFFLRTFSHHLVYISVFLRMEEEEEEEKDEGEERKKEHRTN